MKTVLVLALSLLVTIPSSISQQPNPTQGLPDSPRPDPDGVFRVGNGVSQYRFKPGLREGKPVPIAMTIEVNFQIF